tara:strand:- start:531 stop:731 length:201 start_codon:yes stop_codon:yes gene_type:complete
LFSRTREYIYLLRYGSCLFNKILDELKKLKALELSLFSSATIPEKYLDKSVELKLSKLVLLENTGV